MVSAIDVVLYVVGIVVGAIGFGFCTKSNGSEFKLIEDGLPLTFLLAFWPIVVAVLCLGAVLAAIGIVPCWIVKQLFNLGRWLGRKYGNWKSARRARGSLRRSEKGRRKSRVLQHRRKSDKNA